MQNLESVEQLVLQVLARVETNLSSLTKRVDHLSKMEPGSRPSEITAEFHSLIQSRMDKVEENIFLLLEVGQKKDTNLAAVANQSEANSEKIDELVKELRAIRFLLSKDN